MRMLAAASSIIGAVAMLLVTLFLIASDIKAEQRIDVLEKRVAELEVKTSFIGSPG